MNDTLALLWQYYPDETMVHIAVLVACALALMALMPMTIAAFMPEEECEIFEEESEC